MPVGRWMIETEVDSLLIAWPPLPLPTIKSDASVQTQPSDRPPQGRQGKDAPLTNVSLRSLSLSSHLAGLIEPSMRFSFLLDLMSLMSLSRRSRGVRLSRAGVTVVVSTTVGSCETAEGEVRSHEVVYSSESSSEADVGADGRKNVNRVNGRLG